MTSSLRSLAAALAGVSSEGGRRTIGYLLGLSLVVGLLETAALYTVGAMAVGVAEPSSDLRLGFGALPSLNLSYGMAASLGLLFLVLSAALTVPLARISTDMGARMLARSRSRLITAYFNAPWTVRSRLSEGRLQELAGEYCRRSEHLVIHSLNTLTAVIASSLLALAAVIVAPLLAVLTALALGTITVPLRIALRRVRAMADTFAAQDSATVGRISQAARLSREIELFGVGERVANDIAVETNSSIVHLSSMRRLSRLVPAEFQYAALVIATLLIVLVRSAGFASAAQLGAVLLLLIRALGYVRQVQAGLQLVTEYSPYLDTLKNQTEQLEEAHIRGPALSVPAASSPVRPDGSIALHDVSFAYQPDRPVLSEVSLEIPHGCAVGIMGPSGSGKSTLVHLLVGLLSPTSGSVLLGGEPVQPDPARQRGRVHLVPQDNQLLRGTIADNVRFYRPAIDDADIVTALEMVGLATFVHALPADIYEEVGPGVSELSGGQRQRLGLARALVGEPLILVLDEPTSALDAESEKAVRKCLDEMRGRVTLVVISHDITLMNHVDMVYVLAEGKLRPHDL